MFWAFQRLCLQPAALPDLGDVHPSLAETQRAPFDLTEADPNLVAGYQTEYSSMAFALFWLGEYGNVLLMCALNATLFWGGYLPLVDWAPLYMVPGTTRCW
jgi:NADH-quinone oxidoreductase subunit H